MIWILAVTIFAAQEPSAWRLIEEARVGAYDGPESLTSVSTVITSYDERYVYIAQRQERTIKRFDARTGLFLDKFGRSGTGPGEFRSIGHLTYRGDTLFASDPFQQRIAAFSAEGEHLRTSRVTASSFSHVAPTSPTRSGLFWAEGLIRARAVAQGRMTERPLLLVDEARGTATIMAVQPLGGTVESVVAAGRVNLFMQPFANLSTFFAYAVDGSGAVVVETFPPGRGESHGLLTIMKVTDAADTVFRSHLRYRAAPLPGHVRDSIYESFANAFGGSSRGMRLARQHVELPEVAPPISRVILDSQGRVWLQRGFIPEGAPNVLILDAAGEMTAVTQLTGAVRIAHVSASYVWGVVHDELDVPYVIRYRIEPR